MVKILDEIMKHIPEPSLISDAIFEGANIVLYTKNKDFFFDNKGCIKNAVDDVKKRIELRPDPSLCMDIEDAEKIIREIVPVEAGVDSIIFDIQRSRVIIEAEKPGLSIGKGGDLLKEIRQKILWVPIVRRTPSIRSPLIENIRAVLYENNDYRKKFLNKVGKRIYEGWTRSKKEEWVRITFLGASREVGRSCYLLQTPESRVLLDCGINVAAPESSAFPILEAPEFNINELDAVIVSHSHLDHVGVVPYLFKMGYRGPIYMTAPTRDISALLCLDFIGIAQKEAKDSMYGSVDVKEMVKHTICLDYEEVTDITPDIRVTLYDAGHTLGSSLVHMHIGNGLHNFVFSLDGSEPIPVIDKKGSTDIINIGELIDSKINNAKFLVKKGDVEEAVNVDGLRTVVFNPKTLRTEVKEITGFVRHPIKESLVEVVTETGRKIKVTKSHSLFTARDGKVCQVEAGSLLKGDFVIGPRQIPNLNLEPVLDLGKYDGKLRISYTNKEIDSKINDLLLNINNLGEKDRKEVVSWIVDHFSGMYKDDIAKKYHVHPRRVRRCFKVLSITDHPKVGHILPSKFKISEDFARFLGYFVSEGSASKNTVAIANQNKFILDDCYRIIRNEFNIEGDVRYKDDAVLFCSKQLVFLLKEVLYCGNYARNKRVPKQIIFSKKSILANFLKGYFSGDGGIRVRKKGREINAGSTSQKLILDLVLMLGQFGLVPTIEYNRTSKMHNLHIYNANKISDFLNEIGIENKAVNNLRKEINSMTMIKSGFDNRLPINALTQLAQTAILLTSYRNAKTIGKQIIKDEGFLEKEDLLLFESDLFFDKIKSVTKVEASGKYVYDLRIDGHENFIAGNGLLFAHNTGDFNYEMSNLLSAANTKFPRLETVMMESTYGSKKDVPMTRQECDDLLISLINETAQKEGKVLMPVLGVGRSQEIMIILERAMREEKIPKMPIYVQGMLWDVTAIHSAYPDFFNARVKRAIFQKDENPFLSDVFKHVVSQKEMKAVIEGKGPYVVMATSGMLTGGASLVYFKEFAENPNNKVILTSYQGPGSLGRRLEEGETDIMFTEGGSKKQEILHVQLGVHVIHGFSVPYETPIFAYRNGNYELVEIGKIADGFIPLDKEGVANVNDLSVASFDELGNVKMRSVSSVIKHKVRGKHLIIKTKSGKSVQVSKGHSLFTLHDNKITSIKGDELGVGDFVVIPKKLPESHTITEVNFPDNSDNMYSKFSVGSEEFYKPKKGTIIRGYLKTRTNDMKSLARLLGYYLAEGHLDVRRVVLSFGSHEMDIISDVVKCSESCFGITPELHKTHDTEIQVRINSRLLEDFFRSLNLGDNAKNKKIPQLVYNFDLDTQKEFLDGYFKGDGYDYKNGYSGYLAAKSASRELLGGIAYLLLQNGIISRIKGPFKEKARMLKGQYLKETTAYKLYIGEKDLNNIYHKGYPPFALPLKDIDFYSIYKNIKDTKLKRLCASAASKSKNKVDGLIGIAFLKNVLDNLDITKVNQDLLNTLRSFIYGHIALDQIVDIEEVDCKGFEYDLSVPGTENFCGGYGGVMLHNSGHSNFKQLMAWIRNLEPRPRKIIVVHGEQSKAIEFASTVYQTFKMETVAPKNLDAIRLR